MVDGLQEYGQLGQEPGAETACRRWELVGGSVRPLDEGSSSAVSDPSVPRG